MIPIFFPRGHTSRLIFAAVCTVALLSTGANATGDNLSLADVIRRVQDSNPRLQAQPFALLGADARRDQAAQRPALELGAEVENLLGTGGVPTFGALEATLKLSTAIELGGKRAHRISAADRARGLLLVEQDAERLDIIADAARKFIRVAEAQRMLTTAEANRALAQRIADAVSERVERGASSDVENSNAHVVLAQARVEESSRRSDLEGAWAILAATWGGELGYSARTTATLYELPPSDSFEDLLKGLEENPDVLRFASRQRVYEAQLRLAQARSAPDLAVGAGIRRNQAARGQSFLLSLSVPLGTASRSKSFEREARAQLNQLPYEESATRSALSATLFDLHRQLQAAGNNFVLLRDTAVPMAEQALEQTEAGFKTGRFSLLDLTTAQKRLLEVSQHAAATAAAYHQLFLEIERLTGRSLGSNANPPLNE